MSTIPNNKHSSSRMLLQGLCLLTWLLASHVLATPSPPSLPSWLVDTSDAAPLPVSASAIWNPLLGRFIPRLSSSSGPCLTANTVTINVRNTSDFARRLLHPRLQTVTLVLTADITLTRGLLFTARYSCTILTSDTPGRKLILENDKQPVLRIWNTNNVLVAGVSFFLTVSQESPACTNLPGLGFISGLVCPTVQVWASHNVQIVKGTSFGRIDLTRVMSSLVDSMSVTGVFPSDRSPGLIRVLLSGVGPALIESNITISNNEIYGADVGIMLHAGAVGVNVLNNYIHDYGSAGIHCGDYLQNQGDCMLSDIRRNHIFSPIANVTGSGDAAGIYFNTHWLNPSNVATCNYVEGGDHCYFLDKVSSGITIDGGACIRTADGVKNNGGRRNMVTSLVLKGVVGTPAYTSCLYVPTVNCTSRPGATYRHMFSTYYNRTSINELVPWMNSLCTNTTSGSGRACNPSGGAPATATGGCAGLPIDNYMDLIVLKSQANPNYTLCQPYPQISGLNTFRVVSHRSPVWYKFINYDGGNLGVTSNSPVFGVRKGFRSCDRRKVGPVVVKAAAYLARFNGAKPAKFGSLLKMNTLHILDIKFLGR